MEDNKVIVVDFTNKVVEDVIEGNPELHQDQDAMLNAENEMFVISEDYNAFHAPITEDNIFKRKAMHAIIDTVSKSGCLSAFVEDLATAWLDNNIVPTPELLYSAGLLHGMNLTMAMDEVVENINEASNDLFTLVVNNMPNRG